MKNLRARWIGRYDPGLRALRLGRVLWERGTVGDGEGYSAKLSLALQPRLLRWRRDPGREWWLTLAGVRVHYKRSYGGRQS